MLAIKLYLLYINMDSAINPDDLTDIEKISYELHRIYSTKGAKPIKLSYKVISVQPTPI